uniref:Ovule protein n=1 Tax=Rodentolepis nana TaxID=102285 RepID=A0A0R3TZD9_RODNA
LKTTERSTQRPRIAMKNNHLPSDCSFGHSRTCGMDRPRVERWWCPIALPLTKSGTESLWSLISLIFDPSLCLLLILPLPGQLLSAKFMRPFFSLGR